jgi:molybdenum cofactor synthesis domain-containing protein
VEAATVVPDDPKTIATNLRQWADTLGVDVVLTTGGTGFSPRDNTPEATLAVLERRAAGIAEALRADGLRRTPHACLSRGEAGLRGRTLVVNLPGSLRAVEQGMDFLLPLLGHRARCGEATEEARPPLRERIRTGSPLPLSKRRELQCSPPVTDSERQPSSRVVDLVRMQYSPTAAGGLQNLAAGGSSRASARSQVPGGGQ